MKLIKTIEYTNAYRATIGTGSIAFYKGTQGLCRLHYPHHMYEKPPAT